MLMNKKFIDVEEACKILREKLDHNFARCVTVESILRAHVPAADVAEVKHGWWKEVIYFDVNAEGSCSECRSRMTLKTHEDSWGVKHIDSLYCQRCGAKMDKKGVMMLD